MIVVNEGKPGTDIRSLYWGLISVFNHRYGIHNTTGSHVGLILELSLNSVGGYCGLGSRL